MRVLVTTWVFPTHGGLFFFLDKLIPALRSRGYEFDVVAISPSPKARREFRHLDPSRIHSLRQIPLPRPFSFPLIPFVLRVIKVAKTTRPDVIFCQDPVFSGLPSALAAKLCSVPLLLADHGLAKNIDTREYWENFGFRLPAVWRLAFRSAIRWVAAVAAAIYSPGPDIASNLLSLSPSLRTKTATFPIGIDTELYKPDVGLRTKMRSRLGLDEETVAIFVGRLDVESGLEYLIEAINLFPTRTNLRVIVVGDGSRRERYEEEAQSKAPGVFQFVGYRERVYEWLNAADFFVFPKIFAGGFSIALREAMSVGLAAVATAGVDSHDEIVTHGVDGLLVPPRDPRALSEAILDLLLDEKRRREMGERARDKTVAMFALESFVENMDDLIGKVAQDHH